MSVRMCWVALFAIAVSPAMASESAWVSGEYSKVRLIAADQKNGAVRAGLEFVMKPKWKTYWRSPGQAGFPARIKWTGSDNVRVVGIDWPEPIKFTSFGLTTWGYEDRVILPVRLQIVNAARRATLKASVFYQVCEEVCVPEQADLTVTIPAGRGAGTRYDADIAAFAAKVPQVAKSSSWRFSARVRGSGKKRLIWLTVRSRSAKLSAPDALVEATGRIKLGIPARKSLNAKSGVTTFVVPVRFVPKGESLRTLRVTILDKGIAIESPTIRVR